jgi:hypothetical protein
VTLLALVAIIALAAGGLIVVMLAIARVERIDDAKPPVPSAPPPQRGAGEAMPAPSDVLPARQTPETTTARTQKPSRRPAWHGITQAWTSWPHRHADDPPYRRRARRRQWAPYKGRASWLAAAAAFSVVLGYLLAHI